MLATLVVGCVTVVLPWTPLADLFEFQPLRLSVLLVVGAMVPLYILAAEVAKKFFFAREKP